MYTETIIDREAMLHQVAEHYVLNGLGAKNFDAIPYDEQVVLRAPLCEGGSEKPLQGRENLRSKWWAPLPGLVGKVELIGTYVNKELTAVVAEFHCEIISPACVLRVVDRFVVNEEGNITEQENFFDPRAVTNPGTV